MRNEIEKEYKILVTKEQFYQLCSQYQDLKFIKQINTYYDTKQYDIRHKQGAMRIREKENDVIFTLKMPIGNSLMEHECKVSKNSSSVFQSEEIQALLQKYDIHGPFQEITTCITYRAKVVDEDAELCFDINEYQNITDYEIEYEYKRQHDGFTKFNNILKTIHISYDRNCASKIQRAMDALK